MSAQHKQTLGDHNVLGLRVEHQEVNHQQSVGSCEASGDVAVTQDKDKDKDKDKFYLSQQQKT